MLSLYICGGGCKKTSLRYNNIQGIDKSFCIHTKYSLKELLKELVNEQST